MVALQTVTMMDVDDDFNEKTAAFTTWLRSSGATLSDKIELVDLRSQHAGRGVGTYFLQHVSFSQSSQY